MQLASSFYIELGSFALMSNHIHLMIRTRPDEAKKSSDREVMLRWWALFPVKIGSDYFQVPPSKYIEEALKDRERIDTIRARLIDISWYMKCFNQYISIRANREDGRKGAFWEGRFKCSVILDEWAAVQCSLYVDLNPVRANLVEDPVEYEHSSIFKRYQANSANCPLCDWVLPLGDCMSVPLPFMEIATTEYIQIARDLSKAELSALSYQVASCPTAIGSDENRRMFAQSLGLKYLRGGGAKKITIMS